MPPFERCAEAHSPRVHVACADHAACSPHLPQVIHVVGLVITCAKSRSAYLPEHITRSTSRGKHRIRDGATAPTPVYAAASSSHAGTTRSPSNSYDRSTHERDSSEPSSPVMGLGGVAGGGTSPVGACSNGSPQRQVVCSSSGHGSSSPAAADGGGSISSVGGAPTGTSWGADVSEVESDSLMFAATSLPEWLNAAVGRFHEEQMTRTDAVLLTPTNAVVELTRATQAAAGTATAAQQGEASFPAAEQSQNPPELAVAVRLTSLEIVLTPEQLGLMSAAVGYLSSHQRFELWRRFRPPSGVRPTDSASARLWWISLGKAVKDEIGRRRPRFDWTMLQARRTDRKRYVQLYTAKMRTARHRGRVNEAERRELAELEVALPVEMILFYRQLAEAHDRAEVVRDQQLSSAEMFTVAARVGGFFATLKRRIGESYDEPEEEDNGPDPLQGYSLTEDQHDLLAGLLRQEEAHVAGGDLISIAAAFTLFEMTITLRSPAIGESSPPDAERGASGESGSSTSAGAPELWLICALQSVKMDVSLVNGNIDSVLTCDQARVVDRAAGAAPAHVNVLAKRIEFAADDMAASSPRNMPPDVRESRSRGLSDEPRSPRERGGSSSMLDDGLRSEDQRGVPDLDAQQSSPDPGEPRRGSFAASSNQRKPPGVVRKRSSSMPRHRRSRASVGDPLVGRRVPFVRMTASRAANERAWSSDVRMSPVNITLTMPLLEAVSTALGHVAEAPPALGSYVEAALRTMHGTRAGPSVSWLGDLIDYLIAARPPAPLSEVVGEPLVGGDHADTLRSFSLTLPWMHVLMPELRHTTDCHTAHLRLDGISVHGVSIDEAAFKSAQRLHIDSLQVDIQPKGRDAPITFIPATKNVRGTIASLAVHSPGFENMKSQTKLSIPCLSLCFCPSVYGALMQLMGYSQYFLHEDLPPWQQQVYSLSEFDVHLDEMRIVLFDEDPVVTATSCGPYASSEGASSSSAVEGGGAGGGSWGSIPASQLLSASGLLPALLLAPQHVAGGPLATLSLSQVKLWAISRPAEYRIRLSAQGAKMCMDAPTGFDSSDTVMQVNATLGGAPKEPGSPRRPQTFVRAHSSSGIFRSPPQRQRASSVSRKADAIRLAVQYDMMPTHASPELKCALLELGETKLLWDTASAQRLFSHLYRCLAEGLLPQAPFGSSAPPGDPFHIKKDVWDARISIQSLIYRLADSASSPRDENLFGPVAGPSVIGAMSFGECDVHVRMPWQANVVARATFDLRALFAPADAHMPIGEFEKTLRSTDEAFWMLSLHEVLRPSGPDSRIVYAFESYTPWTDVTPDSDHGVESSTSITFPPMELTYHYATVHRIWDFITLSMIGAHFDASIPYMGTEDFLSRLAVSMRELKVTMPAATSASRDSPSAVIQVGTLTSVKLQAFEEGFAKGDGGMLITLHDVAVLVEDARALGAATSHTEGEDTFGTPASETEAADTLVVLALPQLRVRNEYPMMAGGGISRGVPELTVHVQPPKHILIRATPWQLAVMSGIYCYNFGKYAVYVNPFPQLPLDQVVNHLKLHFSSATVALVDSEAMLPALDISLHNFNIDMRWRQDFSAVCKLQLQGFAVHGAAGSSSIPLLSAATASTPEGLGHPPEPAANQAAQHGTAPEVAHGLGLLGAQSESLERLGGGLEVKATDDGQISQHPGHTRNASNGSAATSDGEKPDSRSDSSRRLKWRSRRASREIISAGAPSYASISASKKAAAGASSSALPSTALRETSETDAIVVVDGQANAPLGTPTSTATAKHRRSSFSSPFGYTSRHSRENLGPGDAPAPAPAIEASAVKLAHGNGIGVASSSEARVDAQVPEDAQFASDAQAPAADDAAGAAAHAGEAQEKAMAMKALLLFGAPPEAEQYREMSIDGLNLMVTPSNLQSTIRYAFETRRFCRKLMLEEFPPYPFESGDTHLKLLFDGVRVWLPIDQGASGRLARRRAASASGFRGTRYARNSSASTDVFGSGTSFSDASIPQQVPRHTVWSHALMLEFNVTLLGEPNNFELEVYHRQTGTHEFSLLPIIERIPLRPGVADGEKARPTTPSRAHVDASMKPEWDPSSVGVVRRTSHLQLSAKGDSPVLRQLYDEIDQLRRSSLRDEFAYASRSASNEERGGSVVVAKLNQGLQLFEPCRIRAIQTDTDPRPRDDGASEASSSAPGGTSWRGGTTQYLLEFMDPARFNIDIFHIRMIKEAASSLVVSLGPVMADVERQRNSVSERWGSATSPSPGKERRTPTETRAERSFQSPLAVHLRQAKRNSEMLGQNRSDRPMPSPGVSPVGAPEGAFAESSRTAEPAPNDSAPQLAAAFGCQELSVLLVSSLSHSPTPIARLAAHNIITAVRVNMEGAEANAEFALTFDHFNRRIAQWEPIIEQCVPRLEMRQFADGGLTDLRLELAERLELVISDDALNGLYGAARRVQEAFTMPLHQLFERRTRPPYAICNETGVTLRYAKAGMPANGPESRLLQVGEQQDVSLWELDPVQTRLHCISVAIMDRHSTQPVVVSSLGASVVPLHFAPAVYSPGAVTSTTRAPTSGAHEGLAGLSALVSRVELTEEGSSTLLRLCSLVQVHNATDHSIDIGLKVASSYATSRHGPQDLASKLAAAQDTFTQKSPHVLGSGETVSVPATRLEQGLVMRPNSWDTPGSGEAEAEGGHGAPYMWASRDSVLWLAKLLEMQRTILHQRMWHKVQRACGLPDSEYLIDFFSCTAKLPSSRGPRQGRLYLTSAALCFCYKKRYASLPLLVPLAEMTALEVSERGDAIVRWGEDTSNEVTIRPRNAPQRTLRTLERNLRMQAPTLVLHSRSDGPLIEKFQLPEDAKLIQDFRCFYHMPNLGVVRGRVYLFTTHLCFAGRFVKKETTWALSLADVVQVEREATCRILFAAIHVRGVGGLYTLSNFWQPDKAIAAIEEARRGLTELTQGQQADQGEGALGDGEDAPSGGSEVISSTIKLVRCWPTPGTDAECEHPRTPQVAGAAPAQRDTTAAGAAVAVPPFLCCVRIDRLQVKGSRRTGGVAVPHPLCLSIHAPLLLENTLPIGVRWSISVPREELLQESTSDALSPEGSLSYEDTSIRGTDDDDMGGIPSVIWRLRMMARQRNAKYRTRSILGRMRAGRPLNDNELGYDEMSSNKVSGMYVRTTRTAKAIKTKHQKRTKKPADQTMVEVCSGQLDASMLTHVHAVSPKQQWHLTLHAEGYERSAPLMVNRGGGLDGSKFLSKLNDVVELKPLAGSGHARTLRLHIANRMRQGAVRELTLYAPYWLVNQTSLPLVFREVRLGTGLLNTAHAMERGAVPDAADSNACAAAANAESSAPVAENVTNTHALVASEHDSNSARARAISTIAVVPELIDAPSDISNPDNNEIGRRRDASSLASPRRADRVESVVSDHQLDDASAEFNSDSSRRSESHSERRSVALSEISEYDLPEAVGSSPTLGRIAAAAGEDLGEEDYQYPSLSVHVIGGGPLDSPATSPRTATSLTSTREANAEMVGEVSRAGARDAPVLFSYSKHDIFVNRLSVRAEGNALQSHNKTPWSKPFSTEALNTTGALRIGQYELSVEITSAPPPALRTKVVTFAPRYILRSTLSAPIAYRQAAVSNSVRVLMPGERVPFHWSAHRSLQQMQVALAEPSSKEPTTPARRASGIGGESGQMVWGREAANSGDGANLSVISPHTLGSMRLSTFSGGFRIDEPGEQVLMCGEPVEAYMDVYEYQRRSVLKIGSDFGEFSHAALLPTDFHGAWADERMERKWPGLPVQAPPGWVWTDHSWTITSSEITRERDVEGSGRAEPSASLASSSADKDEIGWEYAFNWDTGWGPKSMQGLVRRRRWSRRRRLVDESAALRERFVSIDISMDGPSVLVTLSDGELRPPPYIVENQSAVELVMQQKGAAHRRRTVAPGETLPFAWHAPAGKRALELFGGGVRSKYTADAFLDQVGLKSQSLLVGHTMLWFRVSLRGDTRTLTISEKDISIGKGFVEGGEKLKLNFTSVLEGIGISLVRSGAQELAYLRLSSLVLNATASAERTTIKVALGDFRVDNQAQDAQFITMITRSRNQRQLGDGPAEGGASSASGPGGSSRARVEQRPFLQLSLEMMASSEGGIGRVFPDAAIVLHEIEVLIEEAFVASVLQFVGQLTFLSTPVSADVVVGDRNSTHSSTYSSPPATSARRGDKVYTASRRMGDSSRHGRHTPTSSADDEADSVSAAAPGPYAPSTAPSAAATAQATKWYFQRLRVAAIRVNLTYHHGEHLLTDLTKGNPIWMQNIDRMPIVLSPIAYDHVFDTPEQIGRQIVLSYRQSLLKQVYKLLLQIDLLPLALTRGLAAGMKDLFTLPAEGFLISPEMFVKGMVKGSWSLARGVLGGGFKATAQISSSVGRGFATFSFDSRYVRERDQANAHHATPRHIGHGLFSGSLALARGVGDGISGLITAPIEGAKEQGVKGMFKGFGRGAAGLIVKPIAGGLDFVSRTMEGGANTFDFINDQLVREDGDGGRGEDADGTSAGRRMRPPRMLHGPERATRAYSRSEAIAHRVLGRLRNGFYSTEALLLCMRLPQGSETRQEDLLVLTEGRLLVASTSTFKTTEHFPLAILNQVCLRADGKAVELWLKHGSRKPTRAIPQVQKRLQSAKQWASSQLSIGSVSQASGAPGVAPAPAPAALAPSPAVTRVRRFNLAGKFSFQSRARHPMDTEDAGGTWMPAHFASPTVAQRASSFRELSARSETAEMSPGLPTGGGSVAYRGCTLHEILCSDEQACRAIVAALVMALTPLVPGAANAGLTNGGGVDLPEGARQMPEAARTPMPPKKPSILRITNSNLNPEMLRAVEETALMRASQVSRVSEAGPGGLETIESVGSIEFARTSVTSEAGGIGGPVGDDRSSRRSSGEIEVGDRQRRASKKQEFDLSAFELSRRGSETLETRGGLTPRPSDDLLTGSSPNLKAKSRSRVAAAPQFISRMGQRVSRGKKSSSAPGSAASDIKSSQGSQ